MVKLEYKHEGGKVMKVKARAYIAKTAKEAAEMETAMGVGSGYAFIVGTVQTMAESTLSTDSEKVEQIILLLAEFRKARGV